MLSVAEALTAVLAEVPAPRLEQVMLADALGRVLGEPAFSDVDSPPHDKSLVDGYAVLAADLTAGVREFDVIEEVTAGAVPVRRVEPGRAVRIMTGAPLPDSADCVVMVEQSEFSAAPSSSEILGRVRLQVDRCRAGQNIMRRAQSLSRGQRLLEPGRRLRAAEIGLLAETGHARVAVRRRPSVAILSTGNELTEVDETPGSGRIRNSNGPMLDALVRQVGAEPRDLGIGRDDALDLRERIARGLQSDCLVLSGGVSAGVLDLVPQVLRELGVDQRFHKIHMRPGKPLWFGVAASGSLVFGLPGNPVSSLVCFELFVRPALERMTGLDSVGLPLRVARLARDFTQRGDRPTYFPAWCEETSAVSLEPTTRHPTDRSPPVRIVRLLDWQGSADLRTLTDANCLAFFPPGEKTYQAGEWIEVRCFGEPA